MSSLFNKNQRNRSNIDSRYLEYKHLSPPSELKSDDLDKVITPILTFYGTNETREAMQETKQWYYDQEFDDDDFADDWVPNDYNNCDGIDIFMSKLNFPSPINSDSNKRILFKWFCYCLHPEQPKPDKEPQCHVTRLPLSANSQTTEIEQIANKFKKYLFQRLGVIRAILILAIISFKYVSKIKLCSIYFPKHT